MFEIDSALIKEILREPIKLAQYKDYSKLYRHRNGELIPGLGGL